MTSLSRFLSLALLTVAMLVAPIVSAHAADLGHTFESSSAPGIQGHAALQYERRLLLDPANAELRSRRAQLREEAGLPAVDGGVVQGAARLLSLDDWSSLGLAALTVLALLFLHRGLLPLLARGGAVAWEPSRRVFRAVAIGASLVVLLAAAGVVLQVPDATAHVVVAGPASLRISPFADASVQAVLPEGATVHVERAFADHVFVRDGAGRGGWVDASTVEAVCADI